MNHWGEGPFFMGFKAFAGRKRGLMYRRSIFEMLAISMEPLQPNNLADQSESSVIPPWAKGVVRTKNAPANSGLEWTCEASNVDEVRMFAAPQSGGLRWLHALPCTFVVMIDSTDDIDHAVQLRRTLPDISLFVLACANQVDLAPEVRDTLVRHGISISHFNGPSSEENARNEMNELLAGEREGIEAVRRFAESIAQHQAPQP